VVAAAASNFSTACCPPQAHIVAYSRGAGKHARYAGATKKDRSPVKLPVSGPPSAFRVGIAEIQRHDRAKSHRVSHRQIDAGQIRFRITFVCFIATHPDGARSEFCTSRRLRRADLEDKKLPKTSHEKAADHHEKAAKSHRSAAQKYGEGDDMKGQEHSDTAHSHSETAHGSSKDASTKSKSKKM
jgi:hypothetical protein